MSEDGSLWIVLPTGQQAAGGWIDDTLKQRAAEQGLSAKVPLAADFPRQRIEVVRGPRAEDRLQELFLRRGWSDGLPVVPPTVARVKQALAFTDRAPTEVLGEVEPLKGLATVEKVAANAVMAGCRPEYLPVVLAAVECVLDPDFNMRGVQTTDENVTPMLIVNGPVAREIGINASFGVLGPGLAGQCRDRPRAAPGDAQYRRRLARRGGLCRPRPARPLHALPGRERGAEPVGAVCSRTSAVTVTRAESVINVTGGLAEIASVMGTAASGFGILWSGRPTVLIAPAVAADCARRGMSKDDVRRFLWEHGRWSREDWQKSWLTERIVAGRRWPDWVEEAAKAGDIPAARSPDDIVLVVAGGDIPIPQNAYCPSWGFPPACITREVRLPADWTALLADAREAAAALVEK